jgi:translation initiation factor IF-2
VGDIIETFTTEKLADELGQNTAAAKKAEKAERDREAAAGSAVHA